MTDIERLEKYIQQRNKWAKHDLRPTYTDMQKLRELEMNVRTTLDINCIGLIGMILYPVSPRELHLILAVLLLGTAFYLYVELRRANILVEIFQRTAIQKAEDVVNELKARDAAAASQGQSAS